MIHDPAVINATDEEKAYAFEWLRGLATGDFTGVHRRSAMILLDELVRLNALMDPALRIYTSADKQVLTIEGIRYTYDLFKSFSKSLPIGAHFMLTERKEDGVIEITRIWQEMLQKPDTELKHLVTINVKPDPDAFVGIEVCVGKRTVEIVLVPVHAGSAMHVEMPKTITLGLTDAFEPI